MLDRLSAAQNRIVGAKQVSKQLSLDTVEVLYLADDAEPRVLQGVRQACDGRAVRIIQVPTMQELGQLCGIEVGAACAALLK